MGKSESGKKKKWSKGKNKDSANNAVTFDKQMHDKLLKEVTTYKLVTPSVLVDRLKMSGSLARQAIRLLAQAGLIKKISCHKSQLIYTRATAAAVAADENKKKPVAATAAAVNEDEDDE